MSNIKAPKTDTEFRISYAQSWNLAVAVLSEEEKNKSEKFNLEPKLLAWQKYFYDKLVTELIEKEGNEALNKLNTDRSDKIAKHKIDAVEDLDD